MLLSLPVHLYLPHNKSPTVFNYVSPCLCNQLPSSFRQLLTLLVHLILDDLAHHLVTVTTFALIICQSLSRSIQTFKLIFSINPFLRSFYRAMHFSAKRGIAIACRLSVCLSVCL